MFNTHKKNYAHLLHQQILYIMKKIDMIGKLISINNELKPKQD